MILWVSRWICWLVSLVRREGSDKRCNFIMGEKGINGSGIKVYLGFPVKHPPVGNERLSGLNQNVTTES